MISLLICQFFLYKGYVIHQLGIIKSKEKLQNKAHERYQNVSEKKEKKTKNSSMVVKCIETLLKIKNKS